MQCLGNGWLYSYGSVAVLSLIEHKETSHERPMGLVFERVIHAYTEALADQDACRMLAFDFHRFPSSL